MAIFHRATITPTKGELIARWAPTQPWGPPADVPMHAIGSYRFDDPDGRVGMEIHLVTAGGTVVDGQPTRQSGVRSLDHLPGQGLELSVVAEGVETEASAARLAELGCETAQGYFFARPLTTDAFGEWLLTHREACVLAG